MAKILIIDDEKMILELYKATLAKAGHEVIPAANGQEALAILDGLIPDLMFIDIEMPVMSGPEFLANLRRLALHRPELSKIPYIVLTGKDYKDEIAAFGCKKDPGFVKYITKTTSSAEMVSLVSATLSGKRI